MADITSIKSAARIVYDESGKPVVQIPLSLWQEWLAHLEPENSQIHKIKALLEEWAGEPDDTPAEWWDEFREFLKENPVDFDGNQDFADK